MVNVVDLIKQLIEKIMGDHELAAQFAADPYGVVAAQGITEHDLSGVDVYQLAGDVCSSGDVPDAARSAWQGYSSGSSTGSYTPAPAGPAPATHSVDHVVQQLQTVTYVTYQDDHSITQTIVDNSVDNSVDVDVSGEVHGDVDLDVDNATAVGAGSVATAGEDNEVNAATGDGAQVIDGDNYGQANTGDGAVQVQGTNEGAINTGTNEGVLAGGDANNSVVGDDNTVAQVQNTGDDAVFGFGEGDVTAQDNTISNSTLDNSNVGNEQGEGDLRQDASQQVDLEFDLGRGGDNGEIREPSTHVLDTPDPVFSPVSADQGGDLVTEAVEDQG